MTVAMNVGSGDFIPEGFSMRITAAALTMMVLAASAAPLAARDRDDRSAIQDQAAAAAEAGRPEVIVVDGRERSYLLHRSARPEAEAGPLPTVVVLHGRLGTAKQVRRHLAFDALADREGFHVVYPNGLDRSWNDGRPDAARIRPTGEAPPDDIGFLDALMDRLIAEGLADAKRITVTGPSNGGMMTLRVGCELTERVAAIAPLIANMPEELGATCRPARPLPVLVMNGTEDELVPWTGGPLAGKPEKGRVWSTERTVEFWRSHNGCRAQPETRRLPDRDPDDNSRVTVTRWADCQDDTEVQLYRLDGAGHTVPGGPGHRFPRLMRRLLGETNQDIDASEVLWGFFRGHEVK
jgi:polyhydroxybutyrate depolymerase